jgi:5-(carboxyamino)imidazole ribonucleotide synthase
VARLGMPAVLKTRRDGYDGRGQFVLRQPADLGRAWKALQAAAGPGRPGLILETFIPFTRELSLIAVRSRTGEEACYPLGENVHRDGILHTTRVPALPATDHPLQLEAESIARRIFAHFDYVGVLSIELFEHEGHLLVNEMATRVHNSGHWTQDGAATSQFENHLRAILGWPLGSTAAHGHTLMLNLIGTTPAPAAVLALPGAHLHLYGKAPRAGRKLGHVNFVRENPFPPDAELDGPIGPLLPAPIH